MKKTWKILLVVFGLFIEAFGVTCFILPQNFVLGGITGLGRVFEHAFGMDISLAVGIPSVALLLLGYFSLGKEFAASIVFGSLLFPVFLNLLGRFPELQTLSNDPMLCAIFGGALVGIGVGLVIRMGASSGGSDVVPIILNRKYGWPLAPMVYLTDFIILLMQCSFASSEEILLGIFLTALVSVMLNKTVLFGSPDVQFMIVSKKTEEINQVLQNELNVGTTLLKAETGHLQEDLKIILCITTPKHVAKVKEAVLEIDERAFMTMININKTNGEGFTIPR